MMRSRWHLYFWFIIASLTMVIFSRDFIVFADRVSLGEVSYSVSFEGEGTQYMPIEARDSVISAVQSWNGVAPDNNTFRVIGMRWEKNWGIGTLTTAANFGHHNGMSLQNTLAFVVVQTSSGWKSALDTDTKAAELLDLIPNEELPSEAKNAIFPGPELVRVLPKQQSFFGYKFPWPSSTIWLRQEYPGDSQGWHDDSWPMPDYHALDFIVVDKVNSNIIAAVSGTVTQICRIPGKLHSGFLIKTDGTSEVLGYLHLDETTLPEPNQFKIGTHVNQGDKLGRMVEGPGEQNGCGISTGTHLHLTFPIKPFTIDGKTFSSDYTYGGVGLQSTQNTTSAPIPPHVNVVPNTEMFSTDGIEFFTDGGGWSLGIKSNPQGDYVDNTVLEINGGTGTGIVYQNINVSTDSGTPLELVADFRQVSNGTRTVRLVTWPEDHNQTIICEFQISQSTYMQSYGCRGLSGNWAKIQVQVQVLGSGTLWVDNMRLRAFPTYPATLPSAGQPGQKVTPVNGNSVVFSSGHYKGFSEWRNLHLINPAYLDGGLWWKINGDDPIFDIPFTGVNAGDYTHVRVDLGIGTTGSCDLEVFFQTPDHDYYSESIDFNGEYPVDSTPSEGPYDIPIPSYLRTENQTITSLRVDVCGRADPIFSDAVRFDSIGFVNVPASGENLVYNGGFEIEGSSPKLADGWIRSAGAKGDKRSFKESDSCEGNYVFQFKGDVVQTKLVQNISAPTGTTGQVIKLAAQVKNVNITPAPKIVLKITYTNGTKGQVKLNFPSGTSSCTSIEAETALIGAVSGLKVQIQTKPGSGKWYADDIRVTVQENSRGELIPLPVVP